MNDFDEKTNEFATMFNSIEDLYERAGEFRIIAKLLQNLTENFSKRVEIVYNEALNFWDGKSVPTATTKSKKKPSSKPLKPKYVFERCYVNTL